MKTDLKDIHIGSLIRRAVEEREISESRICSFLQCTSSDVEQMYGSEYLDTRFLLKWSKLLEYDFFRIYSQHLILFAPVEGRQYNSNKNGKTTLPAFRKNIYTIEVIGFILDMIESGEKTKAQVIDEYGIPKTTLYKWIQKYPELLKSKNTYEKA